MATPPTYLTLEAFCREYLGFVPSEEELARLEEGFQAYCREHQHVWFRNGQPVMPPPRRGGGSEPTKTNEDQR